MRDERAAARPDPIPELKKQLAQELAKLLAEWNADDVAGYIRTDRRRIFELRRGQLKRFSLEMLIRYVERLRHRVVITVTRSPPSTPASVAMRLTNNPNAVVYGTRANSSEPVTPRANEGLDPSAKSP